VADVVADETGTEIKPLPTVFGGKPHALGRHDPRRRLGRLKGPRVEIVFHFIAVKILFARRYLP
jgi:hypothetical protein